MSRKIKKRYILLGLLILIIIGSIFFYFSVKVTSPKISDTSILKEKRIQLNDSTFQLKNAFLKKNPFGLWELFVQGNAFERGAQMGKLSEELLTHQEYAFVNGMKEIVPSEAWLNVLKYIVAWQNRDLEEYVPEEYREEIYGISRYAESDFDFIASKYQRKLAYHAAHDIGHTLQNLGLVGSGCTTFSVWGENSADSSLLLGRNFDFYVGDAFAENKIVYLVRPDKGFEYVSVSWAGMIGVLSGMNMEGLAVVLNAGPPAIPEAAKTPVSILAREILQYASNIEEAFEIAKKREVFISENIILSSAKDGKTVVIEKSPEQTILNKKLFNGNFVCSNHFQSEIFENDEQNLTAKRETSTVHRFERMNEILNQNDKVSVKDAVEILRDIKGVGNKNIGFGNEMALNQLQGHHAVIFKPEKRLIWVSTQPWQLGEFVCYDLNEIFKNELPKISKTLSVDSLNYEKDSIVYTKEFTNFLKFRTLQNEISRLIKEEKQISEEKLFEFETLNPEHFETCATLGGYFQMTGNCEKAVEYFENALTKAIPWKSEREEILEKKKNCKN